MDRSIDKSLMWWVGFVLTVTSKYDTRGGIFTTCCTRNRPDRTSWRNRRAWGKLRRCLRASGSRLPIVSDNVNNYRSPIVSSVINAKIYDPEDNRHENKFHEVITAVFFFHLENRIQQVNIPCTYFFSIQSSAMIETCWRRKVMSSRYLQGL